MDAESKSEVRVALFVMLILGVLLFLIFNEWRKESSSSYGDEKDRKRREKLKKNEGFDIHLIHNPKLRGRGGERVYGMSVYTAKGDYVGAIKGWATLDKALESAEMLILNYLRNNIT
jgi:hypothetical protein